MQEDVKKVFFNFLKTYDIPFNNEIIKRILNKPYSFRSDIKADGSGYKVDYALLGYLQELQRKEQQLNGIRFFVYDTLWNYYIVRCHEKKNIQMDGVILYYSKEVIGRSLRTHERIINENDYLTVLENPNMLATVFKDKH